MALLSKKDILQIQILLTEAGAPIFWFDDILLDDDNFQAIQIMAITEIVSCSAGSLSFEAEEFATANEVAQATKRLSDYCLALACEVRIKIKTGKQMRRRDLAQLLYSALKLALFS